MSNNKLRILIIDLSKRYGGSSTRVLSLLNKMDGVDIALAGLKSSPVVQAAMKLCIPVYVLGRKKYDPRILFNLVSLIRDKDFQVVDTHNIQSKIWGSIAASITGSALVSTIHSWYAHEHGKRSVRGFLYTAIELSTNRHLKYYITVSKKDQEMLLKSGISPDKINLIYNAVTFDPVSIPNCKDELKNKYEFPKNSIICTAVGRLVPVKGFDILVKAISKIANEQKKIHCLIVGDGELSAELKRLIQNLGMENRIKLTGYCERNNVLSILRASDIFIMSSLYEGTPIALLEAGLLGMSIIASKTGGIPELVVDGEHAILVDPRDLNALANAILKLAEDDKLRSEFGLRAQKRVREMFSVELMTDATYHVYDRARMENSHLN